jgi:hypothetical protein
MIAPAALLAATLCAATPPADAPLRTPLLGDAPPRAEVEEAPLYTLADAPTTPGQAFGASLLTATTGLVMLIGLIAGPITINQPASELAFYSRLGTGLFLLGVGPSMGDLLNHDARAFLLGAGGRTVLAALGAGAIALAASSPADPALIGTSVLFVALGSLVWTGWGAADLVRSLFAPERWVDRQNAGARPHRSIGFDF